MDEAFTFHLVSAVYKIASQLIGLGVIFAGVWLFAKGVYGSRSDVEARLGEFQIVLRRGTPGALLVVAGAVLIGLNIGKGLSLHWVTERPIGGVRTMGGANEVHVQPVEGAHEWVHPPLYTDPPGGKQDITRSELKTYGNMTIDHSSN